MCHDVGQLSTDVTTRTQGVCICPSSVWLVQEQSLHREACEDKIETNVHNIHMIEGEANE